ncbi:MAG: hypothetical protein OEL88_13525, partial [Sterolibacteriaceae bacterium MAG5]|nr:hypothetical protein [Candidatus Nitricoxidireducens bremensis]
AQVRALETEDVFALSTDAVSAFETADIAALLTAQVQALTTAQVAVLSTEQLRAFITADVVALTTEQVAVLTSAQVDALSTAQVRAMETEDVAVLSTDAVAGLTTAGIAALTTDQFANLTTAQVAVLTTSQILALTTADIVALTTAQVEALTGEQLQAMTTAQVRAMETADIAVIQTTDIVAMTTHQLESLSMAQVDALSTEQITALANNDPAQLSAVNSVVTPLVLDLNGDGVQTIGIEAGVRFDLTDSGSADAVGWISASDGFLALDRNRDGAINDGSELFGSATRLADGSRAADGFQALAGLDSNLDGVINAQDALFQELQVWSDANQDGLSQASELYSLADLGITQLNLAAHKTSVFQNGNWIGLESSYVTNDGITHALADVWLQINQGQNQVLDLSQIDPATVQPGTLARIDLSGNGGHGDVLSVSAQDVQNFGLLDLVVNDQTGAGHVQMMIQGDDTDAVRLLDAQGGQWTDGGTTVVDGQTFQILNDGNAQLLIGVRIHDITT